MGSLASIGEDAKNAFRVVWNPEKLDELRIAIVDAFYALPRGGVEIGGVLLGSFEGRLLRIDDFAPMECEHLTGPSFVLSAKDEAALEQQLAGLGAKAVGWFHSHTRSELEFSAKDAATHRRFFPEVWQVGMVLRPANLQPLRANYFFRDSAGAMTAATEFTVEPYEGEPQVKAPRTIAEAMATPVPQLSPEDRAQIAESLAKASSPAAAAMPGGLKTPLAERPAPPRKQSAIPDPPPKTPPIPKPALEPSPEPALENVEARPQKRADMAVWPMALLALAALAAAAFFTREVWMPKGAEPLHLRASDVDGKLIIRWNPIRDVTAGELHITDGSKNTDVALDAGQLSHGLFVYTRQSPSETVRMKAGTLEESTSFAGPLPETKDDESKPKEK